jgi:hypothetical protein
MKYLGSEYVVTLIINYLHHQRYSKRYELTIYTPFLTKKREVFRGCKVADKINRKNEIVK